MGWARHDAGDDDGAIRLFEVSRDAFLEDGRDNRARIARWSIGRCLRSRGDLGPALAAQEELVAELDALDETDGYVFEEIAQRRPRSAATTRRVRCSRAWEELRVDPSLSVDEPARLE